MVRKGIRGGLFQAIYRSIKKKKKHMKDYDKTKDHRVLSIGMQIFYMDEHCHKVCL